MIAGEEREKKKKRQNKKIHAIPRVLDCKNLIIGLPKKKKSAVKGACHQTLARRDGSEVKLGVDVPYGPMSEIVGSGWSRLGRGLDRIDVLT
jgi:hypothetical protein